jgi:MFS family permease
MLGLPRPVWLLGWVSLATDAASEAIYPLLPFFLTRVLSAGAVSLGIVEGAAEAANSLLKIASGRWADRSRAKRPLVLLGYGVSSAVRPLVALATTWTQVFLVRMLDRVGKGVRGAPRDAMLAGWAEPTTRGKVYGFHRGMDHIGAVIGPALASLFLFFFPERYRTLFALTIVPGTIAVLLILLVPEPDAPEYSGTFGSKHPQAPSPKHYKHFEHQQHPQHQQHPEHLEHLEHLEDPDPLPRRFYSFMGVLALFALGNSTDAFLLLKLTDAAGGVQFVPLMWAALHVVKAAVSMVGGMWSDRIGRRAVIACGWLIYALVYGGFATSTSLAGLLAWFMLYGFYFGFAEGTEKALVADLAPVSRRGTAFGLYNAVTGLGALLASIVFGAVWSAFGSSAAFWLGAGLALAATVMLFVVVPSRTTDLVNA